MVLAFYDFINKYWLVLVLIFLILLTLGLLVTIIYYKAIHEDKSFKENLSNSKQYQFSVVIDEQERTVERYYLYDQVHPFEKMTIEEFYVRFTMEQASELKKWLNGIKEKNDLTTTSRKEVIMYDASNSKGLYLIQLENYIAESNRFYLIFKDNSKSYDVLKRASKKEIEKVMTEEEFYDKVNERLSVTDVGSSNFLVVIKCKELSEYKKDIQSDMGQLAIDKIYSAIKNCKSDNELICCSNNSIYLFACSVVNVKKFKKHIKSILYKCSGEYNLLSYSFSVTLVGGYSKINHDEKISHNKILEATMAANTLLNKGKFSERLQLFDDKLKSESTLNDNKLLAVEKVVTEGLFSLNYVPIVGVGRKKVQGYSIQIGLPHAIKMEVSEFISFLKKLYFRQQFYSKLFDMVLEHKDAYEKPFYLSFDFDDLDKVMDAYKSNKEYSKVHYYFCVEFSNDTLRNNNLIAIERALTKYKEKGRIKFGITYNTLNTVYLNDKIYSKASVVLLSGQLIEKALDKYKNGSLLEVYTKVASSYNQEVIGLNVSSLATYEMLVHYKVKKVGGIFLTPYVHEGAITDKFLLKKLKEIDMKTY